jgi:membrane protein DedA with SNARE-associated domain
MPFASPIVGWLLTYRYAIVYPLAIAEGPVLMLISGFLVRVGFFDFWPVYLLLIAGDMTGDIVWYFVGWHGARPLIERYGWILSISEKNVEKATALFHKHQTKILFISKITMGLGFSVATLIAAGAARIPFKKYLSINLAGQFVWTGFLIGAGYFLGNIYTLVDKSLRWAFIGGLIVIAAFAVFGFSKFVRNKMKTIS